MKCVHKTLSFCKRKNALLFLLLAVVTVSDLEGSTPADTIKPVKRYGLKIHQGFVLIHSRELRPIRNSYPTGLELDLAWQKVSQKAWESCLCYPKTGIALTIWDYDNPEVLGSGVTGMFYLEPVFGARHRISFSIRAAFGLSYQNKPYHETKNPNNLSYSTYVAFPLQLGGSMHIRLKPKWYLDITAVYNHFSNGGIQEPNKGINWPTAAVGVGYFLSRPDFKARVKKNWREDHPPETRLDVNVFLAYKEPVSKLYLFSPGLEVKWSRQIARINAITVGAEWMYDNGDRFEMEEAGLSESPHKAGIAIGHEFLLGDFLFSQQFGYYFYKPFKDGQVVYQRYGLVHRTTPWLSLGIGLKAHGHVADFLDFRVGYTF